MTHSIPAEHAQHDLDLIAGHAAGDLPDAQRIRADALLESCTTCADFRRDLVAIASAIRTLPATPAPRDFQLSPAQAARLRRGGWIKSLLRPFAAPGSAARPVAMALTSLGLAGLLVTSILPGLLGGATASAPMAAGLPAASSAAAAPEAGGGPSGPSATDDQAQFGSLGQPSPVAIHGGAGGGKANASSTPTDLVAQQPNLDQQNAGREVDRSRATTPQPNPFVTGSVVLLVLGLALFGLRFLARRTA
jgi:hypothetical protein